MECHSRLCITMEKRNETEERVFVTGNEEAGKRIDVFLASASEKAWSRSYISNLILDKHVFLNGSNPKPSTKLKAGDHILVLLPPPLETVISPEDIPLDIVYEDDDLLVINKKKGMVVHPAPGHPGGTLVNAVMEHCGSSLSSINGIQRPGIVHRIDKDTTGLLVVCKNDQAHRFLAEQLKEHSIIRKYVAIVCGFLKEEEGTIQEPIGRSHKDRKKQAIDHKNGRNAVTHYRVLERFSDYTLVECTLETGRTHQIRVHMASIGHPVLGDEVYGNVRNIPFSLEGQCLHAKVLGFIHPGSKKLTVFESEYPEYFSDLLEKLRKMEKGKLNRRKIEIHNTDY